MLYILFSNVLEMKFQHNSTISSCKFASVAYLYIFCSHASNRQRSFFTDYCVFILLPYVFFKILINTHYCQPIIYLLIHFLSREVYSYFHVNLAFPTKYFSAQSTFFCTVTGIFCLDL